MTRDLAQIRFVIIKAVSSIFIALLSSCVCVGKIPRETTLKGEHVHRFASSVTLNREAGTLDFKNGKPYVTGIFKGTIKHEVYRTATC